MDTKGCSFLEYQELECIILPDDLTENECKYVANGDNDSHKNRKTSFVQNYDDFMDFFPDVR